MTEVLKNMVSSKIGCVAIIPHLNSEKLRYFDGINCAKGRGVILPGGGWEPEKDKSFQECAAREALEETGLICDPTKMKYIWHGPDGFGYTVFGFLCTGVKGTPIVTNEGSPVIAHREDLYNSKFGAWYRILFEVMDLRF